MIRLFAVGDCIDGDVFIATDMTKSELQSALTQARLSCGEHWTEEQTLTALFDDNEERVRVVRSYREGDFDDSDGAGPDNEPDDGEDEEEDDDEDNISEDSFGRFSGSISDVVYFMPGAQINGCADQAHLEKIVDIAHHNEQMADSIAQSVIAKKNAPKELPIPQPEITLEKKRKELPIETSTPAVPTSPLASVVKGMRDSLNS